METGIETMSDVRGQMSDVWYDLNGRRLEMKPATKGVYINNGCKVVVKYTKSCAITMKNLRSGQRAKFPSPGNYFPLVDDI
jgi:hypothetical protein